ncbi:unnamed protein product, partial [marine sediment metagenome]
IGTDWEIKFSNDFHIDVVPGKYSSSYNDYAYLFNKYTQSRLRTSITIHDEYVKKSKRQDIIRLLKLWKVRKKIPLKTFILEQLIIKGCNGMKYNLLEPLIFTALHYINENIMTIELRDPANSSNIITDR